MGTIRKLNLLIVDDDPSIVRLADKYLRAEFAERIALTTFSDPRAARQQIEDAGCDLLISDIQMPGLGGLEMLQVAKRRNAWTRGDFHDGAFDLGPHRRSDRGRRLRLPAQAAGA